jgi:SHS2 domain-containing protein
MKKNYDFLEHTADAKFRSYGSTLESAFESAALAMFSLLMDPAKVKKNIEINISLNSKNKNSLLYDFLEELLFNLDVKGFLLSEIKNLVIKKDVKGYVLKSKVLGDNYKNYPSIYGNIKSITYNDMIIDENFSSEKDKKVMLQVVVDI